MHLMRKEVDQCILNILSNFLDITTFVANKFVQLLLVLGIHSGENSEAVPVWIYLPHLDLRSQLVRDVVGKMVKKFTLYDVYNNISWVIIKPDIIRIFPPPWFCRGEQILFQILHSISSQS